MSDSSPTPSPLAWGVAVLVTAVFASVLIVGGLGARGYAIALLQQEVEHTVAEPGGALRILETPRYSLLFARANSQIRDWRAVVDLVGQKHFDTALETLQTPTFKKDAHSVFLENLIRETLDYQQDDEAVQPPKRESLERKRSLTLQGYAAIQRELLTAIGATEHELGTPPDPSGGNTAIFYREGLFAGLPTLGSIPDGIYDLKAAAAFFPAINRFDKNGAAAFLAGLEGLRTRANEIKSQLHANDESIAEFDRARSEYEDEVHARQVKIEETARGAIVALAEPRVSPSVVTVYSGVRILSRKYAGRVLPPLHTA